ncbi:MAG: DUF58 domain-containing protein [Cryomorphaceae bacterium]|nr:DUF58 domain-containing protein [Cryomorphaceae bacterium]
MERHDLIKKIKQLEIRSKLLSGNLFAGEYHTAFKGRGMTFSEVREYYPGDDVRSIDWNVTARTNTPHIKLFQEERELTVLLLIDVSGSQYFGTSGQTKLDLALEISASLAFSALKNNDKVGAIFFSDQIELFIPAAKGRKHILRILTEMCLLKPKSQGTKINEALQFLIRTNKKRSVCFVISDFTDQGALFEDMQRARKKHDVVAVQLVDAEEFNLPASGYIQLFHAETGSTYWTDAGNASLRELLTTEESNRNDYLKKKFAASGIDHVTCETGKDFIKPFKELFIKRS